jgi:hypothetical protein
MNKQLNKVIPWEFLESGPVNLIDGERPYYEGHIFACIDDFSVSIGCIRGFTEELVKERLDLVVRTVNTHAALVKRLRDCVNALKQFEFDSTLTGQVLLREYLIEQGEQMLAAAEPNQPKRQ